MIYPLIKDDVYINDDRHFFKDEQVHPINHNKEDKHFVGEIINV